MDELAAEHTPRARPAGGGGGGWGWGAEVHPLCPLFPQLRFMFDVVFGGAEGWVLPAHTTVNPNITVMLVGERCAELVAAAR